MKVETEKALKGPKEACGKVNKTESRRKNLGYPKNSINSFSKARFREKELAATCSRELTINL